VAAGYASLNRLNVDHKGKAINIDKKQDLPQD